MNSASSSGFRVGPIGIDYAEGRSLVAVSLCLAAALLALAALWAMIAAFSWQPLQPHLLGPALAVVTFAAFAVLMLALALAPPQQLTFDATQRQVHGRARRRWGIPRRIRLEFSVLDSPRVQAFTQESGDTFHQVHLGVARQSPILMGAFRERQEAQCWCDRIGEIIAHDARES